MTATRTARTVRFSSPLVLPKPRTYPVYAGKHGRILNTKAGDVDASLLCNGLNKIESIVGVQIGHDGLSMILTLLIQHVDTPTGMATFIAATDALLRSCADSADCKLFPELAPGENLTISFERQ